MTDADLDVLVQRDGLEMVLRGAYLEEIVLTPEQVKRLEDEADAKLAAEAKEPQP